ncbi:MAG: hypothetical protein IJF67_16640, partial [Clostridia bacterium]|nr:hypothetical protein [Clostridia bacterium]
MKRQVTAITLLLALLLASCGESSAGSNTTASANTDTTAAPVETSPFEPDDLPADLDLGGKEVNVYIADYNSAYAIDIFTEEETGSRLNDAIYNTQKNVEDRLNVKLSYAADSYTWSEGTDFTTKLMAGIMAGDPGYDLLYSSGNFS